MQPTDWNTKIVPLYRYRALDGTNEGIIRWLLN